MNRNKKGMAAPKAAKKANSQVGKAKAPPRGRQMQASAAAAYATGQSSGKAQIYRDSVDSCRIRHRELVGSVVGTANFATALSLAVNPGVSLSFPWLSIEAQGWEKYRFNSLKLCYYTRTGTNVPGSVILSPDYDAADAAPVNEQIASAYFGTEEDAPWKDICVVFDRNRLNMERFIRTGGLAANLDIKTYDVANLFVSTLDGTAVNWGKVWFEYDVTLINPQLPPGGAAGEGTLAGNTAITAIAPFGTSPVSLGSYALSAAGPVVSVSGLSIGTEYSVNLAVTGTVITGVALAATSGFSAGKSTFPSMVNAGATLGSDLTTFTATANSGTLTFLVTATTITASALIFTALTAPPSF